MDRLLVTLAVFILVWLIAVFELVRRRKLKERHAALWLVLALLVAAGLLFSESVGAVARFLGFGLVSNLVIVLGLVVLAFISLQLSVELGRLRDVVERLTSEVALQGVEPNDGSVDPGRIEPESPGGDNSGA